MRAHGVVRQDPGGTIEIDIDALAAALHAVSQDPPGTAARIWDERRAAQAGVSTALPSVRSALAGAGFSGIINVFEGEAAARSRMAGRLAALADEAERHSTGPADLAAQVRALFEIDPVIGHLFLVEAMPGVHSADNVRLRTLCATPKDVRLFARILENEARDVLSNWAAR